MAIFTLVSATGAPGVTTSALGLALAWPRDVVLVEADRTASQALLAGYFSGVAAGGRGLTSVAQAYRDGLDLADDLPSHFVEFPTEIAGRVKRWFVPGFARPGSSQLFEPVWPELCATLADFDRLGIDAIVDAGRWGATGLPGDLVANTRCLVLVTRASLRALAALRLYMHDIDSATSTITGCSTGLLVVGPGEPYNGREISEQFHLPVWGEIPWQPADAAGLSDGEPVKRRAELRPLSRAFDVTASSLRGVAQAWDKKIGRSSSFDSRPDGYVRDKSFLTLLSASSRPVTTG